ncbi:MAG: 3-phosphoshikimate 1-carboxyvinyltransferase [Nitrososphaerales archaeon]|nr:3-phosphoshikimate 1-carboxyvinyltransferase [Nitrososphaerales archaeon]
MAAKVGLVADGKLSGKVEVPPSKSYTHRAVVMASLSAGRSKIHRPLVSRDTLATCAACKAMGARLEESGSDLNVDGSEPRAAGDVVNVENSGTTLRFMTSVFSLPERGYTVLTGDASIRRRPMQGLLDALSGLGAKAHSSTGNGYAPIIVGEGGMGGGDTEMRGDVSSQFVSSILISAPLARGDSLLRVVDAVSRPYIEATLRLSALHGIEVEREGLSSFRIRGRQQYKPREFSVPADFSSASFVMAAAALVGGKVELSGLDASLPQGDSAMIGILGRMGVKVDKRSDSVIVQADGDRLEGGSFDLSDTPDLLPVLSALALKCDGQVEIRGVAHARFKETDRVKVAVEGLQRMGVKVEERQDGMKIMKPERLARAVLDAHDDHRMFMAFALASLLAPKEVRVVGEESLDVSYPAFLEDMERLGVRVVRE